MGKKKLKKPSLRSLTKRIINFRNARDWKQFHNAKDIAISLLLEAAEVLEHFQWKSEKEIEEYLKTDKNHIAEELADVLYWILLISHDFKINILQALDKKMYFNEQKYPVEKAKGKHTKYNQL